MAGVGRELALPTERLVAASHRVPDGDQRAARVDVTDTTRQEQGGQAADHEGRRQRVEQALLGEALTDDLDDVRAVTASHGPRQDAYGDLAQLCCSYIDQALARCGDARLVGDALELALGVDTEDGAVRLDDDGEGAGASSAEGDADG